METPDKPERSEPLAEPTPSTSSEPPPTPQKDVASPVPKESPPKKHRPLGKEQGLSKTLPVGLVSMTLVSDVVTVTPMLDRVPLLAQWIEEVMPRPVYHGYRSDVYSSRLAYVTLFMIERMVTDTCKTIQSFRRNQWIGDTTFLLPDPMASLVEGLLPWKSPHEVTVEISLRRLREVIADVCQAYDYPWLDDDLQWDAGWLAAWQDITSKVESRGTSRLRKVGKVMASASLLGAGILIGGPTPEAVADIQRRDEVTVVGKKLTARQEALVAATRPFLYVDNGGGCFVPYVRHEDEAAVAACSGYFQGVEWTSSRIKYCLLQSVVAST